MDELAAVLATLAAVSFAFAATLWQRASMASGIEAGQGKAFLRLLTNWVWLLGLVAQIVGVLLQAAALDRGRVAIIQPLLVTTIIWALPLGYFLTHQTIAKRHIVGAAIIVVGLAIFGSLGDPAGGGDDAPTSDWIAAYLVIAAVCVGILLFGRRGGISAQAAIYGTVAGILYGGLGGAAEARRREAACGRLRAVLANWQLWVMAVTGIGGFYLQQISLSVGRLAPSVATVSVATPVVSVLRGALVLQKRLDRTPPWHAVVAIGALAFALLRAVIIGSTEDKASDAEKTAGNAESATGQPSLA